MNKVDTEYFRIVNDILTNGRLKKNRTGIDTIGIFGAQAKYNIDLNAFPILTTKKVHFPAIVHELLWFIRGDTNIKYLVDNNIKIWNAWVYAKYKKWFETKGGSVTIYGTRKDGFRSADPYTQDEFVQKIKEDAEFAKEFGELGEGTYGSMWRAFPYYNIVDKETPAYYHNPHIDQGLNIGHVDQLQKVIDTLKTNPDDRRMIISAWHPYWVDNCALPPCHCFLNFNTEKLTLEERLHIVKNKNHKYENIYNKYSDEDFDKLGIPTRRLNLMMTIRSNDIFLGKPFNITSYALMVAMMAHTSNMVTGILTYSIGDAHLYTNHLDQIKLQMSRDSKPLPKLWLNPEIKSLFDFKFNDIKLVDYQSHATIKAEVAV
jgi:thymidylate synthase